MKRLIITTIATIIAFGNIYAQNEALDEIKTIKLHEDMYFMGQSFHANPDSARIKAITNMLFNINNGREEDDRLSFNDVSSLAKIIPIQSTYVVRAFAYIKKSDLPGFVDPSIQSVGTAYAVPTPVVVPSKSFVPDLFIQRILQQKTFNNVHRLMRALKADGQVQMFGALTEVSDYSSLNLIVFDKKTEQVITVLSPANASGQRTNLATGNDDSLDNYPKQMAAVIYYIK